MVSVVSESMPHLKRGAMRDFENIMRATGRWTEGAFNKQHSTYTFMNGSKLEFFSADQPDKLRGARRNVLFVNEANNVAWESFHQMFIRTSDHCYIDFNPVAEFWAHTELKTRDDADFAILTYKGNEGCPEAARKELERAEERAKTGNPYWKNFVDVYVYGRIGQLTGTIYNNWSIVDKLPPAARCLGYGLDWGFSNDPTALVGFYRYDGVLYMKEEFYDTNYTNSDLAEAFKRLGVSKTLPIICDSAEPKSIEELSRYGFNTKPTKKGADSILYGISILQSIDKILVPSDSVNLIKELRNYVWDKNSEGHKVNKPIDKWNHCFIGETEIITIDGTKEIKDIQKGDLVSTPKGYRRVLEKWNNGVQPVCNYSIHSDIFSLSLQSTEKHKVKTEKGWKEISKLKRGDKISLRKNFTEKYITNMMESLISQEGQKDFTEKYGSTIRVRFLRVITFIIKMGIPVTTLSKIFVWWMLLCTFATRVKKGLRRIPNSLKSSKRLVLRKQKNGTPLQKELNGIKKTEESAGLERNTEPLTVRSVVKNIKQGILELVSTAEITVKLKHLEIGEETLCEVYDLTVEDQHCYYANGVLVHNCLDSARYFAIMKLRKSEEFFVV